MTLQVEQDFSPEALSGHARTGLFVTDSHGVIALFNRAAVKLTRLSPDNVLGSRLPFDVGERLLTSPAAQPCLVETASGTLEFSVAGTNEGLNLIAVQDIALRLALSRQTREFEMASGSDWKGWNTRARALAVLQLLRDYALHPQDLSSIAELAKLTANVMFPQGGEVVLQSSENPFHRWTWGPHVVGDSIDLVFDGGTVRFASPLDSVSLEAAELFAKTLELALHNLD